MCCGILTALAWEQHVGTCLLGFVQVTKSLILYVGCADDKGKHCDSSIFIYVSIYSH